MQATNGLAALSRSHARLIGFAMAIALTLSALVLAVASTAKAAEPPHKTYLSLGNSVAFDYSQELFNENFPGENPAAFEEALPKGSKKPNGYTTDLGLKLIASTKGAKSQWIKPVNMGCPGETTGSFIGNGIVGKQLEVAVPGSHGEAPCLYKYVTKYHLHKEYAGPDKTFRPSGGSQLEAAMEEIQKQDSGKSPGQPVQLVTLDIGSNDLLASVHSCEKEVQTEFETEGKSKYGMTPTEAVKTCLEAHAGKTFEEVLTNIAAILVALRNGSSFCLPDCDNDPNDKGVNYTGAIVFDGFYNPYGAVFTPGVELLPSSNVLELLLNFRAKKLANEFGACYSNPQQAPANISFAFNPALNGEPAEEPPRLQAWTNMANATTAKNGNKAKNGPDIHPTPLGYEILTKTIEAECPSSL